MPGLGLQHPLPVVHRGGGGVGGGGWGGLGVWGGGEISKP